MSLEAAIEDFFVKRYQFNLHTGIAQSGQQKDVASKVAAVLSPGHPAKFKTAFYMLDRLVRNPANFPEWLARTYVLGIHYDNVMLDAVPGLPRRTACLWTFWLADSEATVASEVHRSARKHFLSAALEHYEAAGSKELFGKHAIHSRVFHYRVGETGYRLLRLYDEQVPQKGAIAKQALLHFLRAEDIMKRSGERFSDYNKLRQRIVTTAYMSLFLGMQEGSATVDTLSSLVSIGLEHITPEEKGHESFVNQLVVIGLKLAEGDLRLLTGKPGEATDLYAAALNALSRQLEATSVHRRAEHMAAWESFFGQMGYMVSWLQDTEVRYREVTGIHPVRQEQLYSTRLAIRLEQLAEQFRTLAGRGRGAHALMPSSASLAASPSSQLAGSA